jgi:hypothetical protein
MKATKIAILLLAATMLGGCAGVKNRKLVCSGMLQVGISSDAFKHVWGLPTRTKVVSGDQIISAGWSGGAGGFYKGKTHYQVWSYEDRGVELVFDNSKRNLIGWETKKTVQELAAADQEACQNERKAE